MYNKDDADEQLTHQQSDPSSWLRTDCHELYHEQIMADKAVRVGKRGKMLRFSINQAWHVLSKHPNAQVLEFGVHTGRDLCLIDRMVRQKESEKRNNTNNSNAATTDNNDNVIIHGFDSFRGLPEDWDNGKEGYNRGKFDLDGIPPNLNEVRQYLNSKTKDKDTYSPLNKLGLPDTNIEDTVIMHIGWFEDTLPKFFSQYPHDPIAYCHADADLYSSTITFLEEMCSRQLLIKGTVITFDEYANHPNWQEGEYKAWIEMVKKYKIKFRYICYHAPSATMIESQGSTTYNKTYNKHGYQSVSVFVTNVPW